MEKASVSAEALLARGLAPIKREYIRKAVPRDTDEDAPKQVEQKNDNSTSKVASEKKSRRKMKKILKDQRAGDLCFNHARGICPYGDKCKFNHDIEAYASSKQPDLPGQCPSSAMPECPYGITCRWAGTHGPSDALAQQYLKGKGSKGAPEEQSVGAKEAQNGEMVVQPADAALRGASLEVVLPEQAPQPETTDGQQGEDGTVPRETVALPVSEQPEAPTTNTLDKDLQGSLRRSTYDFSRAQEVLNSLGIKSNWRFGADEANGKRKDGEGTEEADQQQLPCQESGPCDAPQPEQDAQEPNSKRLKTDNSVAADVNAADAVVSAASTDISAADGIAACEDEANGSAKVLDGQQLKVFDVAWRLRNETRAAATEVPLRPEEKRRIDFRGKLYLAPLTTVGNLPYRRICKELGADVTCGEMALATNLLQGQASEWALLKRHPSEDLFGVQVCGGYADSMARCAQLLEEHTDVDFVDVNMGCPIDLVCNRSAGSSLLTKPQRIQQITRSMSSILSCPLTIKVRKGYYDGNDNAHSWLPNAPLWGVTAATMHGRTRQQRYTKLADWDYIGKAAAGTPGLQLIGNGDIMSFTEYNERMSACPRLATVMLARGALIKPWLFTEIKEQRHWDISAGERLDMFKRFASHGLLHWGSDSRGVETTRRFLLEWMSFTHRYIPIELMEVVPQRLHWRAPAYVGRSQLETLLASESAADWVRISEMLLGPVPANFSFAPKHKANAYANTEGGMAFEAQAEG
ncbi:probable tRNA-dihydrouridine(47) synthase [NAD(P)(+)]-like [Coccomyxa sp. Obi]|nr:probable tRNA-dihydrouridine(47) synthase [NAD(P)(+)]-like [Coccomyxa sp. Obi]